MVKLMYILNYDQLEIGKEESGIMFSRFKDVLTYITENELNFLQSHIYIVKPITETTRYITPETTIVRFKGGYEIIEKISKSDIDINSDDNYELLSLTTLLGNPQLYNYDEEELATNIISLSQNLENKIKSNILIDYYIRTNHILDYFVRKTGEMIDTNKIAFNTKDFLSMHHKLKETLMRNDSSNKYRSKYILNENDIELKEIYLNYLLKDDIDGFSLIELIRECEDIKYKEYLLNKLLLDQNKINAVWDLCSTYKYLDTDFSLLLINELYKKIKIGFSDYILPLGKLIQIMPQMHTSIIENIAELVINVVYTFRDIKSKLIIDFISLVLLREEEYYSKFPNFTRFMVNIIREYDKSCYHSADLIGTINIDKENASLLLGHVLAKSNDDKLKEKALEKMKKYEMKVTKPFLGKDGTLYWTTESE